MAQATVGSLIVRVGLDLAEFTDGMTKGEYRAKQFVQNLTGTVTRAIGAFTLLGGAVGGVLSVMNRAAETVAVYKGLSEQIGATAQAVAGLQTAADTSGISLDMVAAASARLTASLSKSDGASSGIAAALAAINIPMDAFIRMDPVEQMEAVSKALAGFADGAGKTSIAIALFGKAGAALLPFLNDLADQGGRQIRLTQEQIEAADRATKQYALLKSELQAVAQQVVAGTMPAFNALLQGLLDAVTNTRAAGVELSAFGRNEAIVNFAFDGAEALGTLVDALTVIVRLARAVGSSFETVWADLKVASTFVNIGTLPGLLFEKNRETMAKALEERNATLAATTKRWADLWNDDVMVVSDAVRRARQEYEEVKKARAELGTPPVLPDARPTLAIVADDSLAFVGPPTPPGLKPSRWNTGEAQRSAASMTEAQRYLESLQRQSQAVRELTEYEKALEDIQAKRIEGLTPKLKEQILQQAKANDGVKQAKDDAKDIARVWEDLEELRDRQEKKTAEIAERNAQEAQSYRDMIDPLSEFIRKLERVDELVAAKNLTPDEGARVKERIAKDANPKWDVETEYAKNAAREIQRTFATMFFDSFDHGLDRLVENFKASVKRMIAEAAAARLMELLVGDYTTTSKLGGWVGMLLKGFGLAGGATGAAPSTTDAGYIGHSQPLATGTNFVPYDGFKATLHKGEQVIPARYVPDATATRAEAPSNVYITIAAPVEPMSEWRMKHTVREAAIAGVADARRRGGRV